MPRTTNQSVMKSERASHASMPTTRIQKIRTCQKTSPKSSPRRAPNRSDRPCTHHRKVATASGSSTTSPTGSKLRASATPETMASAIRSTPQGYRGGVWQGRKGPRTLRTNPPPAGCRGAGSCLRSTGPFRIRPREARPTSANRRVGRRGARAPAAATRTPVHLHDLRERTRERSVTNRADVNPWVTCVDRPFPQVSAPSPFAAISCPIFCGRGVSAATRRRAV